MRIWLLGGFRVSVGAHTIKESEWPLRKAAALVKLLALSPDHRLYRDQAMELLWPESGRRAASNNLRTVLHTARKILDPTEGSRYLASQDEQLVLCPESELWVDVEAFEEAASTARRSREPTAYRVALDLYAGDLLPGDRYEEWAESHRRRLRETYFSLRLGLARLHEESREYEPAIEELRRVLLEEPPREEAHVGLMRSYASMGNKGEALAQYGRLKEILLEELGTEPSSSSRALREEIAAGRFPPEDAPPFGTTPEQGPSAAKHNLPAPRTSFVGREREMVQVKRELAMTRLLTLTGPGGSGKTRLALEIATKLIGAYPDGLWLVELAGLPEGELVSQEVARVLGVHEQPGRPLNETLAEALREKQMLLVVDNCEHLVEAVAGLVDVLLASCPRLRILATSREPLGVVGETIWRVSSLSVPDTDRLPAAGELTRYEAVRLFVDRARLRQPDFELTLENGGAVAKVCGRVEGMPLAIELAAARMEVLSAGQLSKRLDDSLKVLTRGERTADPRHRSLRATLEWSHELLSERERVLFRRLSVFAGGWTLEAAEEVCSGEGVERDEILDVLSELVERSLVVAEAGQEEVPRFRILEPIRQYAHEKHEESAEAETIRRRHAEHFLTLAEEAEPELEGAQEGWLERLEIEHDNLRAALSWVLERGEFELGLRLGAALGEFWHVRGYLSEGRRWLEEVLTQGDTSSASARAKALFQGGYIAMEQGDYERSVNLSKESLALSRKLGDKASSASALYTLGWVAIAQNKLSRASKLFEEALALHREMNHGVGVVRSLALLGFVHMARRDYERAMELHEETLALAHEIDAGFAMGRSLGLGTLASLGRGDHRRARALCEEGLKLGQQLGTPYGIANGLQWAASLASAEGQPVRSARLWGAAEALREEIGYILSPAERHLYGRYIEAARSQLGEVTWERALAEGRAMSAEEAVEYALRGAEEPAPTAPPVLEKPSAGRRAVIPTRRERQIAALVAQGLTNRQIATELFVSERTVETHVSHILRKLNLHSREQIASRLDNL